ncbi:hypothetical protein ASG81_13300 [Paenibacillus sp. Soil522]|nr:hypothetical protein ASG81_13300 [Paenibacillus sp. Soil522]
MASQEINNKLFQQFEELDLNKLLLLLHDMKLKEPRSKISRFFLYLERIPRTKKWLGEYLHLLQTYETCSDELSLSKLG